MDRTQALVSISGISYKPGWSFHAQTYPRYDGTIKLTISYKVNNSNREYAPTYNQPVTPTPMIDFFLFCKDITNEMELFGKVFDCIKQIELHEMREFFSVYADQYDKPFHPHTINGITNWEEKRETYQTVDLTGEPIMLMKT